MNNRIMEFILFPSYERRGCATIVMCVDLSGLGILTDEEMHTFFVQYSFSFIEKGKKNTIKSLCRPESDS